MAVGLEALLKCVLLGIRRMGIHKCTIQAELKPTSRLFAASSNVARHLASYLQLGVYTSLPGIHSTQENLHFHINDV